MARGRTEPKLVAALRVAGVDSESLILDAATGPSPVADLLPVVNARGLPNATRIAALDALEPSLARSDAGELARTAARQHPDVARRAIQILRALGGAESAYALQRVFAERDDEVAADARRAALRLDEALAASAQSPRDKLLAQLL